MSHSNSYVEVAKVNEIPSGKMTSIYIYVSLFIRGQYPTVFVCGWFHVNDDRKIDYIRFIADPRTLLEQMGKDR